MKIKKKNQVLFSQFTFFKISEIFKVFVLLCYVAEKAGRAGGPLKFSLSKILLRIYFCKLSRLQSVAVQRLSSKVQIEVKRKVSE